MALQELNFHVTGMTCGHCVNAVKSAIEELEGIQNVQLELASGKGVLRINNLEVSVEQILNQVNEMGAYHAEILPQ